MPKSPWIAVDTHVHLDSYADPDATVASARERRVAICVSTLLPSEFVPVNARFRGTLGVHVGLGFHPHHASAASAASEFELFEANLSTTRWISEVGLDGWVLTGEGPGGPSMEAQRRLFDRILTLNVGDKVLSVHSRMAEELTVDALSGSRTHAVVFHWYAGDLDTAARIVSAGWFFSVNTAMLQTAERADFLRWVPRDRLLLETDGPFTTTPDARPSDPTDVLPVAHNLALIRGEAPDALLAQMLENWHRLEPDDA